MSDPSETFFTSVGCMDGRVHDPVAIFGKEKFGAQHPDTITEAGLVGLLARLQMPEHSDGGQAKGDNPELLESIKKKLLISIEKHHSKGVIVHGHEDCAGNPVDGVKHKEDILKSAEIVRSLIPEGAEVIPVFVVKNNGAWTAEPL
ncbi:MAG: hypothetical protein A2186_02675 [Candidatus Levybacteria bacterium RIFOXYA1_FULL_41_10]|nr:MAG: hypothetical protein UT44_C0038G0002 [Candidatus Levybacteria bacterium GW2011_GWA1_39_32]KKR51309.1 MAG: hypothetical protein UT87_C0007G0069 [Candidatus Levybacteria bacterium GW2011_GWC1_40_19]KKR72200.1 MAG: hypothetical protein UU15_C0033G0009 [Candidatus Levybacteria bacterium GW2011_GWC2_40_7]KKR94606.1 MAG: hypothetical protein UU45_C0008G0006 [Candidatus Levybacteria bacterium GW2011_GWA2_41_15]KKS00909.1 MAG: hypothetical protein UU52_C0023G0004 [Candidatus Levybacteria bacter